MAAVAHTTRHTSARRREPHTSAARRTRARPRPLSKVVPGAPLLVRAGPAPPRNGSLSLAGPEDARTLPLIWPPKTRGPPARAPSHAAIGPANAVLSRA